MKKRNFLIAGGWLVLVSLLLVPMRWVTTGQVQQGRSLLAHSPVSGGVRMAQAIRSGKVVLPAAAVRPQALVAASLTCATAPCVFPNLQASEGGLPVNEDPIAANLVTTGQLLSGGNDYNCANLQGFYNTGDSGATWLHHCMGSLPRMAGAGSPGVGYDRRNTAYITGIDTDSAGSGVVKYEKSLDNGATWSATAEAFGPLFAGGLTDMPWLEIDTNPSSRHVNNLYIAVRQLDFVSSSTEITVSKSSDHAKTWTTVPVDAEQVFPTLDAWPDLAIGRGGTVYVTWMRCAATGPTSDCGGTTATLLFSKSTDAGATWSTPTTIANVNLAPDTCACAFYGTLPNTLEPVSNIPVIDVDRRAKQDGNEAGVGNLYVAMYNYTGLQMQVLVSTSTDNGLTWGAPVPVAPPTATNDQFFPWLQVSRGGVVGVTWLDRRDAIDDINYEAFAAVSTDHGKTFGTNVVISSGASNPMNDGFGGSFMGDRTGSTWFNQSLFASWMDTSNGSNSQDEVGGLRLR